MAEIYVHPPMLTQSETAVIGSIKRESMPKLIIANWKSHKNTAEVKSWAVAYQSAKLAHLQHVRVVVAPAMIHVPLLAELLDQQPNISLAVQDISPFPAGAYTGAVSTDNLEGLGVKYAILGHSERRRYFHETNQEVANKVELVIKAGMTPVVCVDTDYIQTQAAAILEEYYPKCMIAYEPLSAIGTGISQPVAEVEVALKTIKNSFGDVPVIYGGSVSQDNVSEYLSVCDGALVASNSLETSNFISLLQAAEASESAAA